VTQDFYKSSSVEITPCQGDVEIMMPSRYRDESDRYAYLAKDEAIALARAILTSYGLEV
jgi:hypothetical protein